MKLGAEARAGQLSGAGVSAPAADDRARWRWRARAPVAVAVSRLRAHPGRALLVVAGVAATTAMLVGVVGGSLVAQDRTLQRAVAALPDDQRTFRIDSFGLPIGAGYGAVDRQARSALTQLTPRSPYVVTSFTSLIVAGELVRLAGVDDLRQVARLVAGRWPRECRPARCEVVQVGRRGRPELSEGGIHLVVVGVASVPDRALFGGSLSTASTEAQPQHPVLLLAAGAASFERLPAFVDFYRVYSWIAPLAPRQFHIWQVSSLLERESRVQAVLAKGEASSQLTAPDQALLGARQQAQVAGQRIVLVGGELSALLLGFAFVAATGLRRGVQNEARRLSQRGARRWQLWLALATEVASMTSTGALAGLGLALVAVLALARAAGLPVGAVLGHSLITPLAVSLVAGVWLASTLLIVVTLASPARQPTRRLRLVDIAALGAAVAALIGLTSANASAQTLSSSTSDRVLFALLPGLICFAAAVVAGRLLGPVMRLGERAARRTPAAFHLALLALARAPARTLATVGFVIVSVGLALFAASYASTLAQGARDEAAYAVPLDFTLSEGPQLVTPLDAAPLRRYDSLAPGVSAYPVLRRTANVAGAGISVLSPTVLGLAPAALARLHWRSDFSALSPPAIARRVGADGPAALRGVPLPSGARVVRMAVRVRGVPVMFQLVVESRSGRLGQVDLGERPAGSFRLQAALPAGTVAVIGLEVTQQALNAFGESHRTAEGQIAIAPAGSSQLGPLTAARSGGTDAVLSDWSGWRVLGASLDPGSDPRLAYTFNQQQTVFVRLPQVTDDKPLPVLVSQNVAAAAPASGAITLDFQDAQLPAQIVAVAGRFPASQDLGQGFVVADESRLATALDASAPGTATPDEIWIAAPPGSRGRVERALAQRPFDSLELASRADLQSQLASEPLARGIILTLIAAGLIAVLLAAIGFWVALISDARDERGDLFDLEAQGVAPATLRRQLRLRSLLLLGFGAAGGLALGLVLSRLVVSIISVSAETTAPDPPLLYQSAWSTALIGLAALTVVLALITELTVRNALKGDIPRRGSWSLQ